MQDAKLWDAVADFARKEGRKLTDLYVSNIPGFVRMNDPYFDRTLETLAEKIPSERVLKYETPIDHPYTFDVRELPRTTGSTLGCSLDKVARAS